jgi:hypothetical protein
MDLDTQELPKEQRNESVFELIQGIFQDARSLFTKELLAAKLETKEEVRKIVKAGAVLAIGIGIVGIGAVFLSLMLALLLAQYAELPFWASLGIVGVAFLALGATVVIIAGKATDMNPVPEGTLRSTKEDVRHIGQKISGY